MYSFIDFTATDGFESAPGQNGSTFDWRFVQAKGIEQHALIGQRPEDIVGAGYLIVAYQANHLLIRVRSFGEVVVSEPERIFDCRENLAGYLGITQRFLSRVRFLQVFYQAAFRFFASHARLVFAVGVVEHGIEEVHEGSECVKIDAFERLAL